MNNEVTITLTGQTALDYIQKSTEVATQLTFLYEERDRLLAHNKKQAVELLDLRTKTTKLAADPRLTHDIAMAKDVSKLYDTAAIQKAAQVMAGQLVPKKHKSRLSIADKALLDDLARKPFRSNCMVDQFAAKYNLSPKTVITYINSHSLRQYTLVLGADIRKSHIWENASIVADKLYFTLNDGRY